MPVKSKGERILKPVTLLLYCYYCVMVPYLGYLHTPVEQVLRADVVLVLLDVVQQAAVGHELSDQLHRGGQADPQETTHVRAGDPRHHISLLGCRDSEDVDLF